MTKVIKHSKNRIFISDLGSVIGLILVQVVIYFLVIFTENYDADYSSLRPFYVLVLLSPFILSGLAYLKIKNTLKTGLFMLRAWQILFILYMGSSLLFSTGKGVFSSSLPLSSIYVLLSLVFYISLLKINVEKISKFNKIVIVLCTLYSGALIIALYSAIWYLRG